MSSQRAVGRRLPSGMTELTKECTEFAAALGAKLIIGGTVGQRTRNLLEDAYVNLERSFLAGRPFPGHPRISTRSSPPGSRGTGTRRGRRRAVPPEIWSPRTRELCGRFQRSPVTGWHLPAVIGPRPFISFDSNRYSVHRHAVGRRGEIIADLSDVTVLCAGEVAAAHRRCWAHHQTMVDPDHRAGVRLEHTGRR